MQYLGVMASTHKFLRDTIQSILVFYCTMNANTITNTGVIHVAYPTFFGCTLLYTAESIETLLASREAQMEPEFSGDL
jgi:hypothetical protein